MSTPVRGTTAVAPASTDLPLPLHPLFAGDGYEAISLLDAGIGRHLNELFPTIDGSRAEYIEACRFLRTIQNKPNTFKAYRRSIEKLMLWSWHIKRSPTTALRASDVHEMMTFFDSPPDAWSTERHVDRFTKDGAINQEWRPCVRKLEQSGAPQQSSVMATLAALSAYYKFLMEDAEICGSNPALAARKRCLSAVVPRMNPEMKMLSRTQMTYLIRASRTMADESPRVHAKARFIIALLYHRYLRVSEVSRRVATGWREYTPKMSDFQRINGDWFFSIPAGVSKGGRPAQVTVPPEVIDELKIYRRAIGEQTGTKLPDLPSPAEDMPLLPKVMTNGRINGAMSTRGVRKVVDEAIKKACEMMIEDSKESPEREALLADAHSLGSATAHWLRHTGVSHDLQEGREMTHVRDDARHGTIATTDIYAHSGLAERAESAAKRKKQFEVDE